MFSGQFSAKLDVVLQSKYWTGIIVIHAKTSVYSEKNARRIGEHNHEKCCVRHKMNDIYEVCILLIVLQAIFPYSSHVSNDSRVYFAHKLFVYPYYYSIPGATNRQAVLCRRPPVSDAQGPDIIFMYVPCVLWPPSLLPTVLV